MNENINLVEILKDAPKGTKLWSPLCGECEFRGILSPNNIFKIRVKFEEEENHTTQYLCFSSQGKYCDCSEAECLLFPSKENRDWSTFKAPWKHKSFKPFQKVLIPGIMDNTDQHNPERTGRLVCIKKTALPEITSTVCYMEHKAFEKLFGEFLKEE